MSDLFLVAHKAHGVASFDVAERLACPECSRQVPDLIYPEVKYTAIKADGCDECDGLGYWWIGATSGWRMYPWWSISLQDIDDTTMLDFESHDILNSPGPMPPHSRNLFNPLSRSAEPAKPSGLLASLGLMKPVEPIKRRI